MKFILLILFLALIVGFSSCEFSCSVGKNDDPTTGTAKVENGARIYNNIQLKTNGVSVVKAYLVLENGKRVPDDNFVEFNSTVKMQVLIDSGWTEQNGKVSLGASEKIISEKGDVLIDEADLFQKYADGISVEDSRSMYLSAILKLKKDAPPTSFMVSFRIWDKKGEGFIEGSYMLYSR